MSDTSLATLAPSAPTPSGPPTAAAPETSAPRPSTPSPTEWLRMTPEQRFDHTRAATAPANSTGTPPAPISPPDPNAPPAAPSAEKVRVGRFEIAEDELAAMMTRQAAEDLRKATAPATPEAYELKISPDAKLPGDIDVQFDANDPGMIAAKQWAHAKGLDQGAFSELLTLYASHVAAQVSTPV